MPLPGVEAIVSLTCLWEPVAQAVIASGLRERFALTDEAIGYAIYGQRADGDTPLAEGDRVELTRPLVADAKGSRSEERAPPASRFPRPPQANR